MRWLKWVAVVLLLGAGIALYYWWGFGPSPEDFTDRQVLAQALNEANHCKAASECTRVSLGCPWGNQLVNRDEVGRINSLERHYRGTPCVFEYSGNPGDNNPICVANRCQPGPWPGEPPKPAAPRSNSYGG